MLSYARINPTTTITVPDYRNLLAAWKAYGGPLCIVGRFAVEKPLTGAQLRRLPQALRKLIA